MRKYLKRIKNRSTTISERFNSIKDIYYLPHIAIFVPARNEGYVIENTIRRLAKMNYPKDKYSVFIIVDERELKDDVEIFTKTVAQNTALEIAQEYGVNFIHTIEVPEWYSGVLGSNECTYKKSTKGRALNYALQALNTDSRWDTVEMIGILDADGRLDVNVLQEVAYKRIKNKSRILQGPVFQISNFKDITLTGISAGLELAIHHLTELPKRILGKEFQFLAGTNYFIDKGVITSVGGWDQDTLVEDAELAIRIYCRFYLKTEWLDSPELEQSPENIKIYIKQRERWARGHFYLIKYIFKSTLPFKDKFYLMERIILAQTRFLFDFCIPSLALFLTFWGYITHASSIFPFISTLFLFFSMLIFDLYGFIYRKLAIFMPIKPNFKNKFLFSVKLFLFMVPLTFVQVIPRIKAVNNFLRDNKVEWYKTERTKELITE